MRYIIFLLAITPTLGVAGPSDYQCTVTHQLPLNDTGALQPYPNPFFIGQRFAVDRNSGVIVGEPFKSFTERTQLVDRGSDQYSFKTLAFGNDARGHNHASYLTIREFQKGPHKPFVGIANDTVYTGTCE